MLPTDFNSWVTVIAWVIVIMGFLFVLRAFGVR